ncbi:MAG TPA: hypothetical protein VIY29_22455 [Ktedonobacteraceae bacterium]
MFFDVTDIEAPPLMASGRLKRVGLRLVWLPRFRFDGIEPTILGHDAPTCSRRHGNAELLQRGIHSKLAKQGILLLLFANDVAHG